MVTQKVKIQNPSGLHVRPATRLAMAAEQCNSKIEIIIGERRINCKSILNVVSGALQYGDEVTVCCTGESEEKDMAYMLNVIKNDLE